MNERIKALLLQNRTSFTNGVTDTNDGVYIHGSEENLEKFAELIVAECVFVIQEELDSGQYSQPVHTGFRVSKNLIKEHFGVEE